MEKHLVRVLIEQFTAKANFDFKLKGEYNYSKDYNQMFEEIKGQTNPTINNNKIEKSGEEVSLISEIRANPKILESFKMSFYEFVPYEYSTIIPAIADKLQKTEGVRLKRVLQLDVLPLSEFAPAMDPRSPTFLTIDVEGADLEVLKSNDWVKTLPRVICIEELEGAEIGKKSLIRSFLENYDYVFIKKTLLSSIFVHSEYLNSADYRA
jgi:hypothetical protein